MTTLRYLADAVQIQLKQLGDDRQVSFPLIVQWCGFFINKYRYQKGMQIDSGNYLAIYSNIPVVTATASTNPNIVAGRKYILLPEGVYDYDKDNGIDYISYPDFDLTCMPSFAGVRFTRTTPSKAKRIYYGTYEKPSPGNPYFYRAGQEVVYLLGIETVNIPYLEAGLRTAYNPFYTGSLDDNLDMGEEAMDYVVKNVLDLGRFMLLVPQDRVNDADETNTQQTVPTQKLVSVSQQEAPPEE